MYSSFTTSQNLKTFMYCWRLLTNRRIKPSDPFQVSKSYCNLHTVRHVLGNFQTGENAVNSCRNFSTTAAVAALQRSAQDREKLRNYIFFGGICTICVAVLLTNKLLPQHYDHVYIDDFKEERK